MLTSAQKRTASSAYRALRRAQKLTFQGDNLALSAARMQARELFNRFAPSGEAWRAAEAAKPKAAASATAQAPASSSSGGCGAAAQPEPVQPAGEPSIDEYIEAANQIAQYLRRNVVQAKQRDDGTFVLRFTEETERGDNDTIKAPKLTEARPLRPPTERPAHRRRRRQGAPEAAEGASNETPSVAR